MRYVSTLGALFSSLALGLGAGSAQAQQTVTIRLSFDGTTLTPGADRPTLSPGTTLALLIEGSSLPAGSATNWTFTLDGDTLVAAAAGSLGAGVLAGYSAPAPQGSGPLYTLSFRDASGAVSFTDVQLPRMAGGGGGGAAGGGGGGGTGQARTGGTFVSGGSDVCTRTPFYNRRGNVATLRFFENGLPVDELPRDLDDNDVINICLAIPRDADPGSFSVQVEGTIRGQGISVLGQGSLGDLRTALGVIQSTAGDTTHTVVLYGTYGPFSAPSIKVTVSKVGVDGSQRATVLRVNTTYIANLQFGVGISNIRFNEFVLVPDPESTSDEKEIRNRAKNKNEARPMLLVGFYGWPWEKEFWNGRDIEEEPTLFNRVNPMVGIGLRETILDEFLAGVTFELTKGLFVFGAVHVAQVDKLQEGFKQNEPLAVALDSVPTREAWQSDFIWGFSVDLRIAASVLKGIVGTP